MNSLDIPIYPFFHPSKDQEDFLSAVWNLPNYDFGVKSSATGKIDYLLLRLRKPGHAIKLPYNIKLGRDTYEDINRAINPDGTLPDKALFNNGARFTTLSFYYAGYGGRDYLDIEFMAENSFIQQQVYNSNIERFVNDIEQGHKVDSLFSLAKESTPNIVIISGGKADYWLAL